MKYKTITLALPLILISGFAEASVFPKAVELLVNQKVSAITKAAPKLNSFSKSDSTCADFSGAWTGSCKAGDQTTDLQFTITQDHCNSINLGNEKVEIGQNKAETSSNSVFFMNGFSNTRFSQDGQRALLSAGFLADSPLLPQSINGTIDGEMKKENEKLVVNGSINIRMGIEFKGAVEANCQFNKSN